MTGPQQKVIDALRTPGAFIMPPLDYPGKRTGYVTTGGLSGYICPVYLSTFNKLLSMLEEDAGVYRLTKQYHQ